MTITGLALLFGGATPGYGAAETCNPAGRIICISITDTDDVSPSTVSPRYMRDEVTVRNGGGSAFPGVSVKITLTDFFKPGSDPLSQPSTADFIESASTSACSQSETATNVLNCVSPNLGAGDHATFAPLIFRTSTTPGAVITQTRVDVAVKEGEREQPSPKDPNTENYFVTENTLLEGDDDQERSWIFPVVAPGTSVTLSTKPVGQFSTFPINLSTFTGTAFTAELIEASSFTGFVCPGCFAQQVKTVATGVFSPTKIVELQTVIPLADVPNYVTERNLVVRHKLDSGAEEVISARCSGAIDSGTPLASALSCRRVEINRQLRTLTIEAFSGLGNGIWGFS